MAVPPVNKTSPEPVSAPATVALPLTVMVLPPSFKVLLAFIIRLPNSATGAVKVKVEAADLVSERLSSPLAMVGILQVTAVAPVKVRLEVLPPVKEPEVVVMPPLRVKVNAPILNAPLVKVSEVTAVPEMVVDAVKLTPEPLFIVSVPMLAGS